MGRRKIIEAAALDRVDGDDPFHAVRDENLIGLEQIDGRIVA